MEGRDAGAGKGPRACGWVGDAPAQGKREATGKERHGRKAVAMSKY